MDCPRCGSKEWKMASLIHKEGTSTVSTTTIGGGMSTDGDVLMVGGRTGGTHQTKLSELAAPPKKETRLSGLICVGGFVSLVLAFLVGHSPLMETFYDVSGFWIGSSFLALIGGALYQLFTPHVNKRLEIEYRKALEEYEKKKMCLRCGTFYI